MNSTKLKKILIYITIIILSTSQVESRVFATGENLPLEAQIQESQEITEEISQENPLSNSQEISINEETSDKEENTGKREENQTVNEEKEEKSENDEEKTSELQQNAPLETDTETEDKAPEISGEESNQTLNEEQNKDNNEESKENGESNEKQETTFQEESPQIIFPQPKLSSLKAPRLLGATPNSSQTFTLSFDSDGGEEIESLELPAGTSLSEYRPEDPYKDHAMLLGRFDENGEKFRWDDTTLDQDLHLTAHWAEFEDITYTGVYDEVMVSYTIMDRNVGATSTDIQDPSSEGYFFQWGNNYGFHSTPSLNRMTGTLVASPQAPFYKEYFIKNDNKWFQGSHPNLRGGAEDAPINSYDSANERLIRQGPCPYGYHVPSVEELYVFTMLYFHNHNLVDEPPLFNNIVGKKDGAKFGISAEKLEEFAETFHFPFAGRIIGGGERDRYPGSARANDKIQIILGSSTPVGDKVYIFEATLTGNKSYVNVGGWPNAPVIAMPMRCFQDEKLLNVEWQNDDRTILEKDVDLDFGIMPEYNGDTPTKAPDRNYTYTFSGWNKTIGPLKRNMVFRATYTPHERIGYLVTFSGTDLENTFVTEGEIVEKPEDPTKIDSIFKGWYADAEYSQTFDFSSPITKDTVIYAKWEKKKYTITRKNADGTVLETDTNVPYGTTPHYDGAIPTKNRDVQYTYTFSGRTPTITEVAANQTYTATFKTTTNQYNITFKDENGTILKSATQYPYGTTIDAINIPTPPTKRGFTFMGRNPALGTVTQDRIYTAVYQIQNYTITYKVDGKIYATEQHTYGENITLKSDPIKEGYTFSHWNQNLPTTMPDENIVIEGTFTPITYQITYQLDGGIQTGSMITYTIESLDFFLPLPIKTGYLFQGWTGTDITTPTMRVKIPQGSIGIRTYYANWVANTGTAYTVQHYRQNIQSNDYELHDVEILAGVSDSFVYPEVKSYSGFTNPVPEKIQISADGSSIAKYYYDRKIIQVTFDTQGGDTLSALTGRYGSPLLLPTPHQEGFTFVGWNPQNITNFPEEDVTLMASWKAIPTPSRGGGGSRLIKDDCPNGDYSNSYYDHTCEANGEDANAYSHTKTLSLYEWAKLHGLTSMDSEITFRGKDPLTRAETAKIISRYAEEFLQKTVENPIERCHSFQDLSTVDGDLHDYIIEACNLGYMGRSFNGLQVQTTFDPFKTITKAEVVTLISRAFFDNTYAHEEPFYEKHLEHFVALGITNREDVLAVFSRQSIYSLLRSLSELD